MRMFNVDTTNKYLLTIEEIKDLENAGDDFTTEEELREMLGLAEGDYLSMMRFHPNKKLIATEVAAWMAKIPEGKKSVACTDAVLIEALVECSTMGYPVTSFVAGVRRLGNKFTFSAAKKRVTNKNDYQSLINAMVWSINMDKKFSLDVRYSAYDRSGSLALLKKLLTWDEIRWDKLQFTQEDKIHMREIWDNPTMFDAAEKEDLTA